MSRTWLRRKNNHVALHEWTGKDTACSAIVCKGLDLMNYELTIDKPKMKDRICAACQYAIAVDRGKF